LQSERQKKKFPIEEGTAGIPQGREVTGSLNPVRKLNLASKKEAKRNPTPTPNLTKGNFNQLDRLGAGWGGGLKS